MALDAVAHGLAPPSAAHPHVSGVVVDIPGDGGSATLVALTDDTTSFYTSTGGGTIGAGAHESVAHATQGLLATVEAHLGAFGDPDDRALPRSGRVRIHVLAPSGGRSADVSEASFWGGATDPLTPVIGAIQNVLTAVREVSPAA
jgi:hypothetical protein